MAMATLVLSLKDMPEMVQSMARAMAGFLRQSAEGEPEFVRQWAERVACDFETGAANMDLGGDDDER